MQAINLVNYFLLGKKKERFEIILEPLQALLQLSFLAFSPIGTKLNITNNILYIQIPNWHQGLIRIYYNDSKDDLFYLFNVISRYKKFYSYLKEKNDPESKLYNLIIELSIQGIDNLLLTYQQIESPALLHTLQMYKTMLDGSNNLILPEADNNIDTIFININKLYGSEEIKIIYYTLCIIKNDSSNYEIYMNGLNQILTPLNNKIKKWINDNIVF